MNKICIVEDDQSLRSNLSDLLKGAGYEVVPVTDFTDTLGAMISSDADLILLDITLPGDNGELLLRKFRAAKDTPVIMVTSRAVEMDEVLSMSYGADDYITKPYNPTILLLRISAVLKRYSKDSSTASYKNLTVNYAKGSFSCGANEVSLSKNEMIILRQLFENREKIVSRDDLMTVLWDNAEYLNDNALTVNISRLRTKLLDAGSEASIETRKKQGYMLI
ncbi:MAG: response regulator transcription factor [Lachnospiraceae bacterium]|nr:response regulator transcription factor [Lachnospiraceae bacterium]